MITLTRTHVKRRTNYDVKISKIKLTNVLTSVQETKSLRVNRTKEL